MSPPDYESDGVRVATFKFYSTVAICLVSIFAVVLFCLSVQKFADTLRDIEIAKLDRALKLAELDRKSCKQSYLQ